MTFSLNAQAISRIFSQSPELWAAIQFDNTFFAEILRKHIENIKALAEYVENKDREKFCTMFGKKCRVSGKASKYFCQYFMKFL